MFQHYENHIGWEQFLEWNERGFDRLAFFLLLSKGPPKPFDNKNLTGVLHCPFLFATCSLFFCILHLRPPSMDVPEPLAWCVFRGQRWVQPSAGSAVNASWKSTAIWRIEVQGVPCHLHPSAYHPSRLESPSQRGSLDFKNNFVSALTQNLGTSDLKGTKFSNPRKINRVGVGQFNPV